MTAPILFCHYGNTEYLRYTLRCARLANPDARVILLGDDTNRQVAARSGIEHRAFSDFDHGPELETFDRVYRLITGAQHANVKSGQLRVSPLVLRAQLPAKRGRGRVLAFRHRHDDRRCTCEP